MSTYSSHIQFANQIAFEVVWLRHIRKNTVFLAGRCISKKPICIGDLFVELWDRGKFTSEFEIPIRNHREVKLRTDSIEMYRRRMEHLNIGEDGGIIVVGEGAELVTKSTLLLGPLSKET